MVHTPSDPQSDSQVSVPTTMVTGENRSNHVSLGLATCPRRRGGEEEEEEEGVAMSRRGMAWE